MWKSDGTPVIAVADSSSNNPPLASEGLNDLNQFSTASSVSGGVGNNYNSTTNTSVSVFEEEDAPKAHKRYVQGLRIRSVIRMLAQEVGFLMDPSVMYTSFILASLLLYVLN